MWLMGADGVGTRPSRAARFGRSASPRPPPSPAPSSCRCSPVPWGCSPPVGGCSPVGSSSPVGSCSGNVPGPPAAPTITKVVPKDRKVKVVWAPPVWNGGAKIIEYVVTSKPGKKRCSAAGTKSGCHRHWTGQRDDYTFTARAKNRHGLGAASAPSAPVTPATPPSAPLRVKVVAGSSQVTVSWTGAPLDRWRPDHPPTTCSPPPGNLGCSTADPHLHGDGAELDALATTSQ